MTDDLLKFDGLDDDFSEDTDVAEVDEDDEELDEDLFDDDDDDDELKEFESDDEEGFVDDTEEVDPAAQALASLAERDEEEDSPFEE